MKLKEDFVMQPLADSWVVLPVGESCLDFTGMLTLNESGALLWRALESGADLDAMAEVLIAEYEIDRHLALADAEDFLRDLAKFGCLE